MDIRNKRKVKDGLQIGLAWLVWSVISDWHELRTPVLTKNALIGVIGGSVLFGLIFGLSFRPLFGFVARQYVRGNLTKGEVGGTGDHLNAGDSTPGD
jgi:hypothetical protein